MKKFLILLLVLTSQNLWAQNPADVLLEAYKQNSKKKLKTFFTSWQEDVKPVTNAQLAQMNDTLQNVYNAFTAFYLPNELNKLGGSEWGSKIYRKSKYFVVQDKVYINFTDKIFYTEEEADSLTVANINATYKDDEVKRLDWLKRTDGKLSSWAIKSYGPESYSYSEIVEKRPSDSITSFYPQVKGSIPAVYLTKPYKKVLDDFLGAEQVPLGNDNIMQPAYAEGESQKRKQFLEKSIVFFGGHWGGYWQLHTYPLANLIIFDKKMEYARVYFRMVYQGGEAILKKEKGNWKLLSSKLTWIE